jgi:tripartite-type tricarboxylate transporter receptor subunit TctC
MCLVLFCVVMAGLAGSFVTIKIRQRAYRAQETLVNTKMAKMEESIKKAMDDPDHVKRMKDAGLTLKFMGVEEYAKFMETQNERAKELIALYRK